MSASQLSMLARIDNDDGSPIRCGLEIGEEGEKKETGETR